MRNIRSMLVTGAAVAATAIGGGALANAATTSSASSTSSATAQPPAPSNMPAHGTTAHEDAEKAVTGTAAAKAQAAAVKAVGGTAESVTTDFTGHGYEVTVTKPGGSQVEIHLDSSYNVIHRPGGQGQPPGAPARQG